MKSMKRALAIFLAVLLITPTLPVSAEESPVSQESNVIESSTVSGTPVPTEDPAPTEESESTEEPAPIEGPATTQTPAPTEGPATAQTPAPTEEPATTQTPAPTEEPATTQTPVPTENPISTQTPVPTENSASTEEPVPLEQFNTSESPSASAELTGLLEASPAVSATPTVSPSQAPAKESAMEIEEVLFNTGSHAYSIVNKDAFFERELGDGYFEDDGSYTINIQETNPFFPYEVQFTYNDEIINQWFMTPDDSVEIGGHTFFVSAYFDGTVVTQMSLNVAGSTVIVYPEEKEFTNDGGEMLMSLLPLEERNLSVDLSGFSPAELTMVSVASIFTGDDALEDTDQVVWTYNSDDDYTISVSGDKLDLSYRTYYGSTRWEMIVGDADQLAADNIRYQISVKVTDSSNWLIPTVYTQGSDGNRTNISVSSSDYYDYYDDSSRYMNIYVPSDELGTATQAYVGLSIDTSYSNIASVKAYEGQYATAAEAMAGTDITEQIFSTDMTQTDAGYLMTQNSDKWITLITYDSNGNVTGCLPFSLNWRSSSSSSVSSSWIYIYNLFGRSGDSRYNVQYNSDSSNSNGWKNRTVILYKGYDADETYYLMMHYYASSSNSGASVTAAYVGQYSSIAEAVAAKAEDVKDSLFNTDYDTGGYAADYSQGVYFSIFVGEDGAADQEIYHYCIKTQKGDTPIEVLRNGTGVTFYGLKDSEGNDVSLYVVNSGEDSYGEGNYPTIFVEADADLTNLAPVFVTSDGVNLYSDDGKVLEISGESYHDFSNGAVQYTSAAENGRDSKNFWLQIVKATSGTWKLYINSLEDENSNTREENGVIYSTREVVLDSYHGYQHDILLANVGTEPIPKLSAELESDVLELDDYWTLNGDYDLAGLTTVEETTGYGELPNFAKLRLTKKEGISEGVDVSGTLTIKSGDTTVMVLTLTGTIGNPCITTEEIPQAVKYVPYGSMIQNNNKYYSWNKVSYRLLSGTLPAGMVVKENGEVYGVPTEVGEFTFTVQMTNSYKSFSTSEKTYTLTVIENTDANVDAATDSGYDLTQRVQNVTASNLSESQTMVSQGVLSEFQDIYLDGVKLVEGTDYTKESGSTRITILNQTLAQGTDSSGTHTLGMEFRTTDDEILKRAAQNFTVEQDVTSDDDADSNSGTGNESNDSADAGSDDSGDNESNGSTDSTGSSTAAGAGSSASVLTGNTSNAGTGTGTGATAAADTVTTVSYTVAAGDTLWKIAEKFYGAGAYWQKIYADNADNISDPNKIYVGQVIIIYLTEGYTITIDSDGNIVTVANTDGNYYIVESGDTLWKIAQKVYGKGWQWRKIYQANTGTISDPGCIYVGQVLLIPD